MIVVDCNEQRDWLQGVLSKNHKKIPVNRTYFCMKMALYILPVNEVALFRCGFNVDFERNILE